MVAIKKSIIVEDKIKLALSKLPLFINPKTSTEHKHFFKIGEEDEINAFLKKTNKEYPLIWLAYPFKEKHSLKKVIVKDLTLILIVEGDVKTFIEDRFDNVFKGILYNVFDNVRYLLDKSQNIKITSEYNLVKFPNYMKINRNASVEGHKAIDVWDAVKVTFDCIINDKCLNL